MFDSGGFAWLPRPTVATLFAQDLPPAEIDLLTLKQGPTALRIFDDHITIAAWHSRPSWYIRAENDGMIDPAAQAVMSRRTGAIVINLRSSHVPMLSHPREVAAVILTAAAGR